MIKFIESMLCLNKKAYYQFISYTNHNINLILTNLFVFIKDNLHYFYPNINIFIHPFMEINYFRQLFLVCVALLAFSCEKENENITQVQNMTEDISNKEENEPKGLFENNKVRVRVIDLETEKEVGYSTFEFLEIKAKNIETNQIYEPVFYRLFDLPNGTYEFLSTLPPSPSVPGVTFVDHKVEANTFFVPDPTCLGCNTQNIFLEYYYQTGIDQSTD